MLKRPASNKLAALFFALAAVMPIGSWIILLFVAMPPSQAPLEAAAFQLRFMFSAENAQQGWFMAWAILPLPLLAMAAAYITGQPRPRQQVRQLFALALAIAIASAFLWPVVLVPLTFALYYSCLCLRDTKPTG
jgi:hypothetical protein